MNIAFLIPRMNNSGPINVVLTLIENLDKSKFQVHVITTKYEISENSRKKEFLDNGVKVFCISEKNFFSKVCTLRKYIIENNIRLIHAHTYSTIFLGLFLRVKRICTIHSDFYKEWFVCGGIGLKFMWLSLLFFLRSYDCTVTCAKHILCSFNRFHFRKVAIENGVVLNDFRKKTCLLSCNYLYCGSFDERKNVLQLALDFEAACKENEFLLMAGKGKFYKSIASLGLSHVRLLGFRTDLPEIYADCRFVISYSKSEGLPLGVIEAMSYGLPPILSNIPAHEEIISKNESCGFIIKESLSETLKKLRLQNYKKMSSCARKVVEKHFSACGMAEKYQSLYEKILGEN